MVSVGVTGNRRQPPAVQSRVVEAQRMDSEPIWPSAYFTQHLSSFILQPMFSTFRLLPIMQWHSPPFPQTGRGAQSPISPRFLFDFRIYWWASPLSSRSRCDFLWPGDLWNKLWIKSHQHSIQNCRRWGRGKSRNHWFIGTEQKYALELSSWLL